MWSLDSAFVGIDLCVVHVPFLVVVPTVYWSVHHLYWSNTPDPKPGRELTLHCAVLLWQREAYYSMENRKLMSQNHIADKVQLIMQAKHKAHNSQMQTHTNQLFGNFRELNMVIWKPLKSKIDKYDVLYIRKIQLVFPLNFWVKDSFENFT